MNMFYSLSSINKKKFFAALLTAVLFFASVEVKAQYTVIPPYSTITVPTGSFYIDMGITPQTVDNGLKPYGLIYQLLKLKVPVIWSISNSKAKDGIDIPNVPILPSGTKDLRGGPFIILKQYRTAAVNSLLNTWTNPAGAYKVVGYTSTAPVDYVPVYVALHNEPKWTLDLQNGLIALDFFTNAGITGADADTAFGGTNTANWKLPSQLAECDDVFVMPHADPKWATHGNLYDWNLTYRGAIWLGCHAGSALENMYNPANTDQQTNFLTTKATSVTNPYIILPQSGSTAYAQNSLVLWGNHANGSIPYNTNTSVPGPAPVNGTLATPSDPVSQFMGSPDMALLNGSEQIYLPVKGQGWRTTTNIITYDPSQADVSAGLITDGTAALIAYGPGLGDPNRANVMMEASHDIAKAASPPNIAAQRAFFNFSLLTTILKSVEPTMTPALPATIYSGTPYALSFTLPSPANVNSYSIKWSSSCPGTFSPNNTSQNVTFTPGTEVTPTECLISVTIRDACNRVSFSTQSVTVQCNFQVTSTVTNPCANTPSGGAINMTTSNGVGPYTYTWTKTGGSAPFSGSGTVYDPNPSITGLSAGSYSVTVTANDIGFSGNGDGCRTVFTTTLTQSPTITPTATPVAVLCNGGSTGAINVTVTGGIPGYTYLWSPGGNTTQNRSGLTAGTYSLTVTDSKGCIGSTSATVTLLSVLIATPTPTHVKCNGASTGSIAVSVTGGTAGYTYLWNDGTATQNRSALPAGNYSVTVTDANGCKATASTTLTQPANGLTLSSTQVNVNCFGGNNGSVDLSVSGGTPAYSYAWSNGSTTQDITNLAAGNFTVTVTDANLCKANLTATITQPATLSVSGVIVHPTCPATATQSNSDGSITLTVNGGTPVYTYVWEKNGGPFAPTTSTITGLTEGTYKVTVTDAKGCIATATFILTGINPVLLPPSQINH